jgi:hypothetical protein
MRHPNTFWLSLVTVLAIIAGPSRRVLALDCPLLSPGQCEPDSSTEGQGTPCCCDSDNQHTGDEEAPTGKCRSCFYCVTTDLGALDLPVVPLMSSPVLDSYQYLTEAVRPSDWVLQILRPPAG